MPQLPNSNTEIQGKVFAVLKKVITDPSVKEIRKESRLIDELGIDSLKIAEISLLLEEVFNHSFFLPSLMSSVEDPYHLTVQSLTEHVQSTLTEGI